MGFLSGQESVGVNPRTLRKLTRLVGGRNLAMLGAGAALGGAALAGGRGTSGGPSEWDAPRGPSPMPASTPPPPPPAAVIPPPPPPAAAAIESIDSATSIDALEAAVPAELAYAIARTMVAAALADGALDRSELAMVETRLDTSGLAEEQIAQIRRDLVLPPQPAELAALVADADARDAVYRFAGLVILADDDVSDLERAWLDRLASAFDLDAARKAALEADLFAPDDEV